MTVALVFSLPALPVGGTEADVRDRLRAGFLASETVIDLSDTSLSPAAVGEIYAALLQDDPALFHVAPRLGYIPGADGAVLAVYPAYTLTGDELTAARAFFRGTVLELLAEVDRILDGHPHSEAEVALLVHDCLAARYDYDTSGTRRADAYRFFRDGVGVCQAYTLAAMAILRAAGLEADFVAAPAMDHAWVHVRVGGAWYHMDVTRDDPLAAHPDGTLTPAGKVNHTRVLRSDEGMHALGYSGFSCSAGHVCTDGRYESAEVLAVLAAISEPLIPLSVGSGAPLVWVASASEGAPLPLSVAAGGITPHAPGDVDGDGAVTPADLLHLYGADCPEAWRAWVREAAMR